MNYKRKSRRRFFLLMRSGTPPISSEFRGGGVLNTPNPPSVHHWSSAQTQGTHPVLCRRPEGWPPGLWQEQQNICTIDNSMWRPQGLPIFNGGYQIQSKRQNSTEQCHNGYSPRKIQLRISLFTAREVGRRLVVSTGREWRRKCCVATADGRC